ncbi:MAG: DUF4339 domain-containing protein [Bdellovibrionales bacterium]|nr:DUF4339 domain-containing protein [Bdellovibrionales bacterium]
MEPVKYYVSHNDQQLGPWTVSEIVSKVNSGELSHLDYLYDESAEDWISLLEFEPVGSQLQRGKPALPPKEKPQLDVANNSTDETQEQDSSNASKISDELSTEWYILKGENKFGPFSYTEVVKMLQQKVIFEFDFAWNASMTAWQRIAEITQFNEDKIKALKNTLMPEISEVFFRRRHRRVAYGGTILVHDNKTVWKGRGVEISSGGAGVVMENSMVVPGQVLYLHFKPGDGVPPFNAVCEVVSKKFEDGVQEKNASVQYGLKFLNLNEDTQGFLQEFTKRGVAA